MSIRTCRKLLKYIQRLNYSTTTPKSKPDTDHCLIVCKHNKFNHHLSTSYDKFKPVPLASKGWNHPKAKNDCFTINPLPPEKSAAYSFEKIGIRPELLTVLKSYNIFEATEYQNEAIQGIQSREHVMLAAETGCGKTIAYLLPTINSLTKSDDFNTPSVLILTPNRELAHQVGELAEALCQSVGLRAKIVTGGRTKRLMMNPEFEEIDVLVGTPGAIGKLANVGIYKLQNVKYTVLDESDTLLDDSFNDRIGGLLKKLFHSQLIFVTATLPKRLPDILKPIENNLKEIVSLKVHRPILHVKQQFLR